MKKCTKCGEYKSESDFYKSNTRYLDGLQTHCKSCDKKYHMKNKVFLNPVLSVEDRFLKYVNKTEHCWEWVGYKNHDGYGVIRIDGKNVSAHRFSYETYTGEIPKGLVIDHLCRNHACVNPSHLEPVTNGENIRRGIRGAKKYEVGDTCKHGHVLREEDIYRGKTEYHCKICSSIWRTENKEYLRKYNREYNAHRDRNKSASMV